MTVRETSSGLPRSSPEARAAWLREVGGVEAAAASGQLSEVVELPLVEALLLGLMRQGVTKFLAVFGHGSTAVAEMLRIYESHGLVRCWQFRNEVEMAHAATALSWVYGEVPAVVTSIGPGAFQAMAGSLAAASNGIGVYHLDLSPPLRRRPVAGDPGPSTPATKTCRRGPRGLVLASTSVSQVYQSTKWPNLHVTYLVSSA